VLPQDDVSAVFPEELDMSWMDPDVFNSLCWTDFGQV